MAELDFTNIAQASISTPGAGVTALFAETTDKRLKYKDDAGLLAKIITNVDIANGGAATSTVSAAYATDTYLAGSACIVPINSTPTSTWKAGGTYYLKFDMVKTAFGVATPIITIRMGTTGTTSDTTVTQTITFAVGTAAVDTGIFEVWVTFRTVGSGTTATIQSVGRCTHYLAATGLTTTGASGTAIIINAASSGFNSTTPTIIGASFNGGSAFVGTSTNVSAMWLNTV